jgi:hypothetical protein
MHVMPRKNSGFDANLPANVRYDKRLSSSAKILYAEIRALCNQEGYCWASTKHFEEAHGMSKRSILSMMADLETCGYIVRGRAENGERHITLAEQVQKTAPHGAENCTPPPSPLIYNNTLNMVQGKSKAPPKPTAQFTNHKLVIDPLFLAELRAVFDAALIDRETPKMERWLALNKPKKDYRRFISNWLNNASGDEQRKSTRNNDLQQQPASGLYDKLERL